MTIPESAGWITENQTKSVSTSTFHLDIATNETTEARSAEITFSNEESGLSEKVTVNQEGNTKTPVPEMVDLGLSVKWASFNVGATKPEEYGGHYQWAGIDDVTDRSIYVDWDNCPYHTGSDRETGWTKYVPSYQPSFWSGTGSPDNKTLLDPEDDVAHVTLGGKWRMPTGTEFDELINNCTWTWTQINGVNGYKVASNNPGYSDKWIFLPAAGFLQADFLSHCGTYGNYVASSLGTHKPFFADALSFFQPDLTEDAVYVGVYPRYDGASVRPVYGDKIRATGVSLEPISLTMDVGETYILSASVIPSNAVDKGVEWFSSNTDVATVHPLSGKVTAVKAGSATITVRTTDGGYTATCSVTVKSSEPTSDNIVFKDTVAKSACVAKYDTNGDGEVSIAEAEAVTSFIGLFTKWESVTSFDEIIYFKNVHSISGLFDGCTKLVSITIPENITDLGTSAFRGCSSLTSVNLPSNITTIGNYSFNNCRKLQTIDIPSKVTAINQHAFSGCSSLVQLAIPNGVTSLGTYAFSGCSSLTSVKLPSNITSLGSGTFYKCSKLTSIDIPSKVTSIGLGAFQDCKALQSVSLPANLVSIGQSAFYDCSALSQIAIPSKVTSLGVSAFAGCSSLTTVNIPSGVLSIPNDCFYYCTSLTAISLPSGVTSIGLRCFCGCTSLTAISLPSGVTSIPEYCFYGCSSLTSISIPSGITYIGSYAFDGVDKWGIELPSSVSSLGSNCFGSGIICVILPATSPVSIQSDSFGGVKGIFVPANMIEMYKVMKNWSNYSGRIRPISSFKEKEAFTLATSGAVDMGTSVKWAACNLGASKPEEYGGYYQWAGLEDVTNTSIFLYWYNCPYHTGSTWEIGWTKYIPSDKPSYWSGVGSPDNKTVLESGDDVAVISGGNWRIPTREECKKLVNNCLWVWTAYQGINGKMVYCFETANKIFLPAAGYREDYGLYNVGSLGYYWSSSLDTGIPDTASGFYFGSDFVYTSRGSRYEGLSVRPVSE